MSPETALRILGLNGTPSVAAITEARRKLLSVLHPDKHSTDTSSVFQRVCSDINEAHDLLMEHSVRSALKSDSGLESALFDVHASSQWNMAVDEKGTALARFDRRFAKDKIMAVAILGVAEHSWSSNGADRQGNALYILAWNRTKRRVESLDIREGLLIDDKGNQYSADGGFYWVSEDDSRYHSHARTLAPNAKLDGFLLYPPLRSGATAFVRWYLAITLHVGDQYVNAEYDVELPQEPQRRARTLLPSILAGTELDVDDEDEDLDDDEDDDDPLSDEWLYGDRK